MSISIIKGIKSIQFSLKGGLILMFLGALMGFHWVELTLLDNNDDAPQIKKQVLKEFELQEDILELKEHTETEYDVFGKIVELVEYGQAKNGKSKLKYQTIYKYDASSNKIGTLKYNQDGNLVWSESLTLGEDNQVLRIDYASYEPTHQHSYTLYEYDEHGNKVSTKTYNDKDEQTAEKKRLYNHNGELEIASNWSYVLDGDKLIKKSVSTKHEYDHSGRLVRSEKEIVQARERTKEINKFENGFMRECIVYKNGKLVDHFKHKGRDTSTVYREYKIEPPIPEQDPFMEYDDALRDPFQNIEHEAISTITFKKDELGNIIKKVFREYGKVTYVIYYDYDSFQNLSKKREIDKVTGDTKHELYTYDEFQNILRKETYSNEELIHKKMLTYHYYNR
ncbi:MAG: hypothetical protein MK212_00030 [Saprospiraceae bacterium]|nr:hypothetical protein [Saprospiraceae bacterium]